MRHRTVTIDGLRIFYRDAGPADAPMLVLLHGFPSASHQYARLIERPITWQDRVFLTWNADASVILKS